MKISASIYSGKNKSMLQLVKELDGAVVDYFHIDCNDDLTVFDDIKAIRRESKTPIDLHIISPDPEKFFAPMFKTDLDAFTKSFNVDKNILNFKQEKIISQMFIVAQKKYATEVVEKEGKVYKEPEIHVTGIEVVKSDTPEFCSPKIKESLRLLFESMNKDVMLDYIRKVKEEFMKQPVDMIATPKTVNDYDEYIRIRGEIDMVEYAKNKKIPKAPLHCPQHVKAAMNFNYMVERFGWPEAPVSDNTKVKYIYVKENNILKTNVIAFTGDWNSALAENFEIDYELQFYKKFVRVVERFFETLGWGKVNLDINDLGDYVSF